MGPVDGEGKMLSMGNRGEYQVLLVSNIIPETHIATGVDLIIKT